MRTRRALSTVVGVVFAIIALTTTITYISYSMNLLGSYDQTVLTKNQQLLNAGNEKFQISSVTVPNGKFNITVTNTGTLPINFTKLWIQDTNPAVTDSVRSYVPQKGFVTSGGTLTNIGQDLIDPSIVSTDPYNIKLVTSRGNAQQVTVNSASAQPLNIQLMFLPATVPSGFNATLVMIVTNNSTGTLSNISPSSLPNPTYTSISNDSPLCTAVSNVATPPSYNTLAPGSTAIFTWNIKTTGGGGDTCKFTFNTPLQNGYSQTVSATATMTVVNLTSTSYAANAGIITLNYTSFRWTQGGSWNTGWGFHTGTTVFSVQIINNNATNAGVDSLWISKNTILTLFITPPPNNNVGTAAYIVKTVTLSPLGVGDYNPDNSVGVLNGGGTATIYFGSTVKGGHSLPPIAANDYIGFVSLYGEFSKNAGGSTNTYAQNLPFIGMIVSP